MNEFERRVSEVVGGPLHAASLELIQANLGLKCNQTCAHCHVVSSPRRKESMDWETMTHILRAVRAARCRRVDITGGAPELNPHFRRFVETLRAEDCAVQVRTNLTVIFEPGMDDLPGFFRRHEVRLVASLPCYLQENVDRQRGDGVFEKSVRALRLLNETGYGREERLPLTLVYNPVGPHLPPPQQSLEAAYRKELEQRYGIVFTQLWTITNMPIGRFWGDLRKQGKDREYLELLKDSYNGRTVDGLMCRHQINVDWDGTVYDCDFNLALRMPVDHGAPTHIRDFDPNRFARRRIVTGRHCFGCTAGCGSSCGGALV